MDTTNRMAQEMTMTPDYIKHITISNYVYVCLSVENPLLDRVRHCWMVLRGTPYYIDPRSSFALITVETPPRGIQADAPAMLRALFNVSHETLRLFLGGNGHKNRSFPPFLSPLAFEQARGKHSREGRIDVQNDR